jgi:hypothetical protein
MRVWVERGSMPYSAVSQPWPLPFRKPGTFSSMEAVHTLVSPNSISTEPSACLVYWRVMRTSRSWKRCGRWGDGRLSWDPCLVCVDGDLRSGGDDPGKTPI